MKLVRVVAQLIARLEDLYVEHIDQFDDNLQTQDWLQRELNARQRALRAGTSSITHAASIQEAYTILTALHAGCRRYYSVLKIELPDTPPLDEILGDTHVNPRRQFRGKRRRMH